MLRAGAKRMADGKATQRTQISQTDNHSGVQETQLDPIREGWHIFRGPPDYTHAVIPWVYEQQLTTSTYARDYAFRMTSPYDPLQDSSLQDANPGTGVANVTVPQDSDARNFANTAAYWEFYASMYKYYHVLGCRYRIRIENRGNERFYVHHMFVTKSNPPATASNWDMMIWPDTVSQLCHPHSIFYSVDVANQQIREVSNVNNDDGIMNVDSDPNDKEANGQAVQNKVGQTFVYIEGEYRPGDADRQVHEDSDVNIWTLVNQNPTLREALLVRLRAYDNATPGNGGGDTFNYNRPLTFNISVECEYLVEFKELQDALRWPTNRNPLTATINTSRV
ncbi:hypothetical protein 2 [Nicoomyvirus llwydnae]|uniref:Uncharacterized protein n=2 Tax=unclassified Parvoviridae TaxID=535600 RepID=A0A6M9BKH8_9VIRU|nr:hypothetical protein 2 [Forsythia suspensa parvo-like virus]QKK82946.1 hypothetical protein 2 [Trichosanthes kirilowii parvo-like virus]